MKNDPRLSRLHEVLASSTSGVSLSTLMSWKERLHLHRSLLLKQQLLKMLNSLEDLKKQATSIIDSCQFLREVKSSYLKKKRTIVVTVSKLCMLLRLKHAPSFVIFYTIGI